ncbi:hypothetical protein Tco_0948403 [Tanacetum coccineum]
MPRECLKIIESKSKVLNHRSKALIPREYDSSTQQILDIAENECISLPISCKHQPKALSILERTNLPALTKTQMILELADRTISTPTGIAEDVFVKVGTKTFLEDGTCLIDVTEKNDPYTMTKSVTFKVGDTTSFSYNIIESVNRVDVIDIACEEYVQEVLEISESGNPTSTSDLMIDSRSPSFTPFGGSDFLIEEIDEFLEHDDSIPLPVFDGIYYSSWRYCFTLRNCLSVSNMSKSPSDTSLVKLWCLKRSNLQ